MTVEGIKGIKYKSDHPQTSLHQSWYLRMRQQNEKKKK